MEKSFKNKPRHGRAGHIKSGDIICMDDGTIINALVNQIIVNDDGIEIHFKCGVVIEKELE